MTVNARPLDLTMPLSAAVMAVVHRSPVGAHVALLYRATSDGARRVLHQAWHYDTRDDSSDSFASDTDEPIFSVAPSLDEDELEWVRASCARVARHIHTHKLPYALASRDAYIDDEGAVRLGSSRGMTCATFLLKIFEHARVDLIDVSTWDAERSSQRIEEDTAAQRAIVRGLRSLAAHTEDSPTRAEIRAHADALERDEVGRCSRVRAEEVAAAFGLTHRPAAYAAAEPAGRDVLTAIRSRPAAHTPDVDQPRNLAKTVTVE